jgi:hypothetical protein
MAVITTEIGKTSVLCSFDCLFLLIRAWTEVCLVEDLYCSYSYKEWLSFKYCSTFLFGRSNNTCCWCYEYLHNAWDVSRVGLRGEVFGIEVRGVATLARSASSYERASPPNMSSDISWRNSDLRSSTKS